MRPFSSIAAILIAATVAAAQEASPPRTLTPITGEAFAARLVSIGKDKAPFLVEDKTREIPLAELLHWGQPSEADQGPVVALRDGGLVVARSFKLTADAIQIESRGLGSWELPLDRVRGILLSPAADPLSRDRALANLARSNSMDGQHHVELVNGDLLTGQIVGTAGEKAAAALHTRLVLSRRGGELRLPLERIQAIRFPGQAAAAGRASGVRVGFRDGSTLWADSLSLAEQELSLKLSGRDKPITIPYRQALRELTYVRPPSPQVEYLSDMKLYGYKHAPFLSLERPFYRDRNAAGGRLRAGGRIVEKGLGMPATSRIAVDLGGAYERFESLLAVDDLAGRRGSVQFRVFLDRGEGKWQSAYASPVLRGGDPARRLSLDVTGARRMTLMVTHADRGDELDYANWLSARLVKKAE